MLDAACHGIQRMPNFARVLVPFVVLTLIKRDLINYEKNERLERTHHPSFSGWACALCSKAEGKQFRQRLMMTVPGSFAEFRDFSAFRSSNSDQARPY